ncbi:MAG: CdaR family protein [bacterium]
MGTFFENPRIKLIALIMASIFWLVVATESDYSYDAEVPILFTNLPANRIIVQEVPAKAKVRFHGKGKFLLAQLFYRDAYIEIDLSHVHNQSEIELTHTMVQLGRRGIPVTATQVLAPHAITIKLGGLREKVVPIRPAVKLHMPPGYTLVGEIELEPDSLTIAGPDEFVRTLQEVQTVPREFRNVHNSFEESIALQAFPDSMKIALPVESVRLSAEVQKIIELNLREIPVRVRNVPSHLKVSAVPSTVALTVEGGERLLMHLKREDISAYIDYARIRSTEAAGHALVIEAPPGVRCRNLRPALFKLMMERNHDASARD